MSDTPEVPLTPTRPEAPPSSKEGGNADAAHRTITEAVDEKGEPVAPGPTDPTADAETTAGVAPQIEGAGTAEGGEPTDRGADTIDGTDGEEQGEAVAAAAAEEEEEEEEEEDEEEEEE